MGIGYIVQTGLMAMWNLSKCLPDERLKSIADIDFRDLYAHGYRSIIFDLDATLVPFQDYRFDDEVLQKLREANDIGYQVCIHSNCAQETRLNVETMLAGHGLEIRVFSPTKTRKPLPQSYLGTLTALGARSSEQRKAIVFVGDSVLTDVLGANFLGMHTILVDPYPGNEPWSMAAYRMLDTTVLYMAKLCNLSQEYSGAR